MQNRPILVIVNTIFDKRIITATVILLLVLICMACIIYINAPKIIPIHFNTNGKIDGYGSKATIFILPIISCLITALLQKLCKYPHIFNYPQNINEQNAATMYQQGIRLLRWVNISLLLVMIVIQYLMYMGITKQSLAFHWWYFVIIIGITTIVPLLLTYKMGNKKAS